MTTETGTLYFGVGGSHPIQVRNEYGDRWLAMYEGKWRRVYIQVKRTYIICRNVRYTIAIDGV